MVVPYNNLENIHAEDVPSEPKAPYVQDAFGKGGRE